MQLGIERLEERIAPQLLGGGILMSADHEVTATQATQAHACNSGHPGDACDSGGIRVGGRELRQYSMASSSGSCIA